MADSPTDPHAMDMDYAAMQRKLQAVKGDPELFKQIVNTPFDYPLQTAFMFLGIVVLLLVDKKTGTINRVTLSDTELAKNTTEVSYVPFEQIKIPLKDEKNIIAQAVRSGEPRDTTDWKYLFTPALTAEQARLNQASGGIAYSAVYPLKARAGGAMIFSYYQYQQNIGKLQREFMSRYAKLVETVL